MLETTCPSLLAFETAPISMVALYDVPKLCLIVATRARSVCIAQIGEQRKLRLRESIRSREDQSMSLPYGCPSAISKKSSSLVSGTYSSIWSLITTFMFRIA